MVVPQAKPAATPPAKQEEIVMAKPAAPVVDEEDRAAAVGGVLQHDNAHSGAQSWKERRDAAVPVAMPARSNSDLGKVYDSCSALMALGEEEIDPYTSTRIKWLYIVSDSTGFTASHALTSVLAQFNQRVSVDDNEEGGEEGGEAKFEVRTHMFSNVLEPVRLDRIVQLASKMQACIIYTLVNPALNARIIERCETLHVEFEDLLGPLTTHLSEYLHASPTGQPRGAPGEKRKPLSSKYFSRIEAVEFTIKHDDGTLPVNLPKADVVLLGVSRSSKTPLAIYLAQQFGFKVANVPVLLDKPLPAQLLQVDPRRVFCLLVDEKYLRRVRAQRLANSDLDFNLEINKGKYAEVAHIQAELANAKRHYMDHPAWSVIDVTGRSVEENAAIIAELMPGKPTPVEAALHALDCNFFIIGSAQEKGPSQGDGNVCLITDAVDHSPILFASDGFLSSTGYTRSEVVGRNPRFLHGPGTDPASIEMVRHCLAESVEGSVEMVNYRKDGSCLRKILHLRPVRGHGGTANLMFATQTEVDDDAPQGRMPGRKRKDDGDRVVEMLAVSKKTLFINSVQHKGGIAVGIWDGESGTERMPLLFASQGFFTMFGYPEDEIIGKTIDFLMGPQTALESKEKIQKAMNNMERVSTCVLMLRKDKTTFWNYLSIQPVMNADGSLRFFVGTMYSGTPGEGGVSREVIPDVEIPASPRCE